MGQANPALRSRGRKGPRRGGSGYPAGRERLTAGDGSVVYREAVYSFQRGTTCELCLVRSAVRMPVRVNERNSVRRREQRG